MKLLLDENLAPRLVQALVDLFPGSEHVSQVGLGSESDSTIWDYARTHEFAILTKDADFADRSVLERLPPKVIWLRLGNCSTNEIERLLRAQHESITLFLLEDAETCLLLSRAK